MAVVSFKEDVGWVVARWAFRRLLEDIEQRNPHDIAMSKEFEQAIALDGLHIGLLEPYFGRRILHAMHGTVQELLDDVSGRLRKELDEEDYQMYREALPELFRYIEQAERELEG